MAELGGDGVGLLRSEFLFMERASAPSEDEQFEEYTRSHRWSGGNKLSSSAPSMSAETSRSPICQFRRRTIRSSASGEFASDSTGLKSSHATSRAPPRIGIRLDHVPDDRHGCRAARYKGNPRRGSGFAGNRTDAVRHHGGNSRRRCDGGDLRQEADFFSIGTNDLTPIHARHGSRASQARPKVDALNPGLLRLIAQTVEGARKHGRFTGVCGGIAGDAQAVPILSDSAWTS